MFHSEKGNKTLWLTGKETENRTENNIIVTCVPKANKLFIEHKSHPQSKKDVVVLGKIHVRVTRLKRRMIFLFLGTRMT